MIKIFKRDHLLTDVEEFCDRRGNIEPIYNKMQRHTGIFIEGFLRKTRVKKYHRLIPRTYELYAGVYGSRRNIVQFKKQIEEIDE